jgi:outer membrane protein TolC
MLYPIVAVLLVGTSAHGDDAAPGAAGPPAAPRRSAAPPVVGTEAPASPSQAATPGLSLEAAVGKSLAISEDVRIARARREQADAGVGKARSALLPDLTASGTYTRRAREVTRDVGGEPVTVQSINALGGNITVATKLFDARAWPVLAAARRSRDAAKLDEVDQRRRTAFATAETFLAALGFERIAEAAAERRAFAEARRKEVAARVEAQLTGRNDLTQTDLELATAQRDLTAAQVGLAEAYVQLAYLIGEPVVGPLAEPTGLYARAIAPIDDPGDVRNRPDLGAARLRVRAAAEAAREPSRRIWPRIDAFGQMRFTNEAGLSGRTSDWSAGLTATWEIWDGGERAADADAARAEVEIKEAEADRATRLAATELESAVQRLRGAQADIAAATTAAEAANRHADEVAVLYGQGLVRALELTDAGARRFDAEVALVRVKIGMAAAYLDMIAAAGGEPVPGTQP